MPKIFRGELDTRHFTFEAYGNTKKEAIDTLIKCCKKHCKQYKCSWVEFKSHCLPSDESEWEDMVYEIKIGVFYRDKEKI